MASKKKVCSGCGNPLGDSNFYKSNSELNKFFGTISICKECLIGLYDTNFKKYGNEDESLYRLCMQLDTYYDPKLVATSKEKWVESNMDSIAIYYFSKINMSQYKGKTFIDSDLLDVWRSGKIEIKIDKEKKEEEISQEVIDRWGDDIDKKDYKFLEKEYNDLCSFYDTTSPLSIRTYQQIAKSFLDMRNSTNPQEKKQIYETISKMQNDCKIKATQLEDNGDEDANLVGMMTKMIQNDEPIPDAFGIFADADKIDRLFTNQFIRTMQSVLGVDK